jgi:N-acetylmuramoyl-L-alanine amidase
MGQGRGRNKQPLRNWTVALLGGVTSMIGMGLFAPLVDASQLQFWRFNPAQNRLEFTTDGTVQPRVQLIPNPVRLVVDLPGVQLSKPTVTQNYSATVRSVRVGQFDTQTARIVIELSPGYTVDPQQVKVVGASPTSWSIDLPNPQFSSVSSELSNPNSSGTSSGGGTGLSIATPPASTATISPPSTPTIAQNTTPLSGGNVLEDILVTPDGLFVKTQQAVSNVQVSRNGAKQVVVDISGVQAATALTQNDYKMDYHGVQLVSVRQLSTQPSTVRVTLKVSRRSPNWMANTSRFGGVVLLPQGGSAKISDSNRPTGTISLSLGRTIATTNRPTSFTPSSGNQSLTTLHNIALGGNQLLIQGDRPLYYSTGWDGPRYRITVRGAQWAQGIRTPQVGTGSPLSDLSVRQEGQNVSIFATPGPGVRIGILTRMDAQTVVLNLNREGSTGTTIFQQSSSTSPSIYPPTNLSTPNGRKIVVIDPGHGGPDVGAIGIGGLRETNIVLPMGLEVARLLQQKGLQVYLTRDDEIRDVDLPPRVALAQQVHADVFVSIHANSINMSRPDVNGATAYFAPGSASGQELSQVILNSIVRSVNIGNRGVHSARFYVIRHTTMPATLIETGFVTGAEDAPKLADPNFRSQMAAAIAQGIIEFLNRR